MSPYFFYAQERTPVENSDTCRINLTQVTAVEFENRQDLPDSDPDDPSHCKATSTEDLGDPLDQVQSSTTAGIDISNEKSLVCLMCNSVVTMALVVEHLLSTHVLHCLHCKYEGSTVEAVHEHNKNHFFDQYYNTICVYCQKAFSTKRYLVDHIVGCHEIIENKSKFRCVDCEFRSCFFVKIADHIKNHHSIFTKKCKCNRLFTSRSSWQQHKKYCKGLAFFICICGYATPSFIVLERHVTTQHNPSS